jgi:hypothetical protein
MYQKLVKGKRLFIELDSYVSGDHDKGLYIVSGKLAANVSTAAARDAVWDELERMKEEPVPEKELEKVKNKVETNHVLSQINYLNLGQELAAWENVERAELINDQPGLYRSVSAAEIRETTRRLFRMENCSQLNYLSK